MMKIPLISRPLCMTPLAATLVVVCWWCRAVARRALLLRGAGGAARAHS